MQWLEELWTSVEAILWYVMVGHVMKWFYIKFFEIVMFFDPLFLFFLTSSLCTQIMIWTYNSIQF